MTSLVDGRSTLHIVYYANGIVHFDGYDTRLRAANELIYRHQLELPQTEAIASLEEVKAGIDRMILDRQRWFRQEICAHDWIEVPAGKQCVKPDCELFIPSEEPN